MYTLVSVSYTHLDRIGAAALLKPPASLVSLIQVLFNGCLRLHYYPSPWKRAKVIMLPKPRKLRIDPSNDGASHIKGTRAPPAPVSYTHLDVYKRQLIFKFSITCISSLILSITTLNSTWTDLIVPTKY